MTPQQFISKWQRSHAYRAVGVPAALPGSVRAPRPAQARRCRPRRGLVHLRARRAEDRRRRWGWADVWMRGHFGWEYKGKKSDLAAAYKQLLLYREDLENPPLLVVCDMDRFEIHTNFTGTVKRVYAFDLDGARRPGQPRRAAQGVHRAARPAPRADDRRHHRSGRRLVRPARRRPPRPRRPRAAGRPLPDEADVLLLRRGHPPAAQGPSSAAAQSKCKDDPQRLSRLLASSSRRCRDGGDFGVETISHFNGGLFADARPWSTLTATKSRPCCGWPRL
jgi:hypothetical protein